MIKHLFSLSFIATLIFNAPTRAVAAGEGQIRIDGSSTVFPISEAIAEEFGKKSPKVRVTVGTSGTGGGFKKFCVGETDISDASRPIKASELEEAKKKNITFIELPVGIDGLAVVVHPSNKFLKTVSKEQLKKIWEPGSKIQKWSDLDPSFPKEKIALFGPGADSGTFDYFTEEVVGKARASRTDYTASEDDNVLIKGVSASKYGMAYFGHGYYMANKNRVKALPVDAGKGPVEATDENVASGKYPLSRYLYIYVASASAARPEVDEFVKFYLDTAKDVVHQTGYLPLKPAEYAAAKDRYAKKVLGTAGAKDGAKP